MWSVECGVVLHSTAFLAEGEHNRVKFGVWNVERKQCGVWNVECGVVLHSTAFFGGGLS